LAGFGSAKDVSKYLQESPVSAEPYNNLGKNNGVEHGILRLAESGGLVLGFVNLLTKSYIQRVWITNCPTGSGEAAHAAFEQ
jgi:hypothetical protein